MPWGIAGVVKRYRKLLLNGKQLFRAGFWHAIKATPGQSPTGLARQSCSMYTGVCVCLCVCVCRVI